MTLSQSIDSPPVPRACYLALEPDGVLTFLHMPANPATTGIGALICPPFGWDEVCSYRARRAWAEALASAGYPTARIDLPGTADSGGSPNAPGRLDAWTRAVSASARWLREETGCARIAAIGIGIGGLVAYTALARGAEIDDLALWAVPSRGWKLVRELRAFSLVEHDRSPSSTSDPTAGEPVSNPAATEASSALVAGGFVMTAETRDSLAGLDLTKLQLPDAERRRVLLLARDGLAPDPRLREHLERCGAVTSVAAGDGYGTMMTDPRLARHPREVFARTISWLGEAPREPARSAVGDSTAGRSTGARSTLELAGEGGAVRETPITFEHASGRLFGVLSEPAVEPRKDVTAVLFSAGGVRRIGPNRMWVEVARRWAARGVPTLRVDLAGVGDSDGDELRYLSNSAYYRPEMTEQALATLDMLERRGLPRRFIAGGVCSGAYWAFRGAVEDQRVAGAFMINLSTFSWSESLAAERALRNARALLGGHGPHGWTTRNLLEAGRRVLRTSLERRKARAQRARETELTLDSLRDRGTELLLAFSANEALHDDLVRDGQIEKLDSWPNLRLQRIPGTDHTFRALALQAEVRHAFDDALERVLDRVAAEDRRAPGPDLSGPSVQALPSAH